LFLLNYLIRFLETKTTYEDNQSIHLNSDSERTVTDDNNITLRFVTFIMFVWIGFDSVCKTSHKRV